MFKRTTYDIDMKMDQFGNIEEAQCECAAGAGPKCHCKHMRAMLCAILDQKRNLPMQLELTCTEQLQSFHRPSQLHKGSPVKSADLEIGTSDNLVFDPIPIEFQESNETVRCRVRNATISLAARTGIKMPMLHTIPPANVFGAVHDHDYLKMTISDTVLHHDNIASIEAKEVERIEESTRGQATDPSWFQERSKRLTSSNFGRICKLTDRTNKAAFAKSLMIVRRISSRSLAHGVKYEPVAIEQFEQRYGMDIAKSGLIVSQEMPYLACSPDGLIGNDTIVEVKCPSASKNKPINSVTVPYIKTNADGSFYLQKKHDYMYQIQGCMHITGRVNCKFIVFTLTDMLVLDIAYDKAFVSNMLEQLKKFYDDHFKPAYLNKHIYRDSHLYSV